MSYTFYPRHLEHYLPAQILKPFKLGTFSYPRVLEICNGVFPHYQEGASAYWAKDTVYSEGMSSTIDRHSFVYTPGFKADREDAEAMALCLSNYCYLWADGLLPPSLLELRADWFALFKQFHCWLASSGGFVLDRPDVSLTHDLRYLNRAVPWEYVDG